MAWVISNATAEHEFAFGEVLRRPLMRRMRRGMGRGGGRVQPVNITQQEDPLPRHHHVVEEDDAIHLLEARGERVVEMRTPEIEAVAAQEFEPRRAAGDRKAQRKRAVALGVARHARRIDPDLVGEWPEGQRECARRARRCRHRSRHPFVEPSRFVASPKPPDFNPWRFCVSTAITAGQRHALIAQAAYFRAERRGFRAGHELEDWLAAEAEVERQLASARRRDPHLASERAKQA